MRRWLSFCIRRSGRFGSRRFISIYEQFADHENTLAATLAGSVQKDVYYARARGYESALDAALVSQIMCPPASTTT